MLKYKPEEERTNTKEMEDAPAGLHRMKVNGFRPGVSTEKWSGDIVEFTNGSHVICEFINDQSTWKFGRLAKAIGEDAVNHYKQTDREGFSTFNPGEWIGREVSILVEEAPVNGVPKSRIKKIQNLANHSDWDTESCEPDDSVNDDPSPDPFQKEKSSPPSGDEIPF